MCIRDSLISSPNVNDFLWFKPGNQPNRDGRILEMAYNSPLFYNEGEEIGRISKQLYLSFPSSVVIFYTDKPPTVGLSIFQSIEDAQELNFEELNELIKENPDLKTHLSQLPVFEMDPLQTSDANKILGFSENIFTEMDKGAEENYMVTYNCLLYTSPSPRDLSTSRMPSSA